MNKEYLKTLQVRNDISSLIDINNNVIYKINSIGLEMFNLLNLNYTTIDVAKELSNKYLVDSNIIVSDINNFINSLNPKNAKSQNINLMDNDIKFPLYLEIEITSKCNWNCSFCYNTWKNGEYVVKDIDFEIIKNILIECKNNNCMMVRYSGGEPTLHKDFNNIIKFGNDIGLKQALFTNATKIDLEMIKFLTNNNVQQILVSLHGDEKVHDELTTINGSYKQTLRAIKMLVESDIDLIVEITVTKNNIDNIPNLFEMLTNYGVKHVNVMKYVNTKRNDDKNALSEKEFRSLIENIKEHTNIKITVSCSPTLCGDDERKVLHENNIDIDESRDIFLGSCQAGIRWASISIDGGIRCCPHSDHIFDYYDSNVGISPIFTSMRKDIIETLSNSSCSKCYYYKECLGGCYLEKLSIK
jgi:radical SAM protein with 4Fe4S-binding SPASM domain